MRMMPSLSALLLLIPLFAFADEPTPKKSDDSPADKKSDKDFAEFSKLLQQFVANQPPKEFEHREGWGATIPLPDRRLPLPNLRTYLKDGDRVVLPHGAWKKVKVKLEDPKRDVKIQVKDFRAIDRKTYRLELDADVVLGTAGEWQQWQKGLLLVGLAGEADASLRISVGCDVGVSLSFNKLPPEINVDPKITDLGLDLKDIRPRGGPVFTDEKLRNDIKGLLRSAVKLAEPQVKDLANQAIAQSIKDGKGGFSAGALLKALPTK
jgi:hypothetical protein